ncbi:MAG: hypothetical protein V1800_00540 [Candidatus Latescibacterota bacterium]
MQEAKPEIACPVFLRQEDKIGRLTNEINRSKDIGHKAGLAEKMAKEVELLLSCQDHDERSLDCVSCYTVSILRNKMAKLILRIDRISGSKL